MAYITEIKDAIRRMDAGEFQILCDDVLNAEGYGPQCVCLGTHAGTHKTTKGTPDSYYMTDDGKYIFVEYTVQQEDLGKKIKSDLDKCFDVGKTKIPLARIAEVIYFFNSSNLKPEDFDSIVAFCSSKGIPIKLWGIDAIANALQNKHRHLIKDHLRISICTGQIQSVSEFIKEYDAKRLSAPLDTEFLGRETEITSLDEAFSSCNTVILSGASGTGKTRLALEYATRHAAKNNEELYCLHSKAMTIWEDLALFFSRPGAYFLVIDDANQFALLNQVFEYALKPGYLIRIIMTVRDYAVSSVVSQISEFVPHQLVKLKAYSDEEIKKLVETALGIKNEDCLKAIISIAEGNARIAMLAGKTALLTNRIQSIADASQLYDEYFGSVIRDNESILSIIVLKSVAIVTFLDAVRLDRLDAIHPILNACDLSKEAFVDSIYALHDIEFVDIFADKAVRMAEQCMANYLLKYILFDKKYVRLSEILRISFFSHRSRTIESINMLLNIYRNEHIQSYVEKEVDLVWNEFKLNQPDKFEPFLRCFYGFKPTETLLWLRDQIHEMSSIQMNVEDIDTKSYRNYQNVSDEIIKILVGFSDQTDLPAALDLFFEYYLKRPDMYMQFYHAIIMYFSIDIRSHKYGYFTQRILFEKMEEYSKVWKNEFIVLLFFDVASHFLQLDFHPHESGRNDKLILYTIHLQPDVNINRLRQWIWDRIFRLSQEHPEKVKKILYSYHVGMSEVSESIVECDWLNVLKILENMNCSSLEDCLLAEHLDGVFKEKEVETNPFAKVYENNSEYLHYCILRGGKKEYGSTYEIKKKERISKLASECSIEEACGMINMLCNVHPNSHDSYRIRNGIEYFFHELQVRISDYLSVIEYYLAKNTPMNLNPESVISALRKTLSFDQIRSMIQKHKFADQNNWMFAFYSALPDEMCNDETWKELMDFLRVDSDECISQATSRTFEVFKKFLHVDENAMVVGCRFVYEQRIISPRICQMYFYHMFIENWIRPDEVVEMFQTDIPLLMDIYLFEIANDFVDYNGEFLFRISKANHFMIEKYIEYMISRKEYSSLETLYTRLRVFYSSTSFLSDIDYVFDKACELVNYPVYELHTLLEALLMPVDKNNTLEEKQDAWIKHFIEKNSNDMAKMEALFDTITKLTVSRRVEYVEHYITLNPSYEAFKSLPLSPHMESWSNSAVPMLTNRLAYFEKLLPLFSGIKYIEHKKHVEDLIHKLKLRIEAEEVNDIINR